MSDPVKENRVVRYTDLVRELRSQIASGTLSEGDRLPSFMELRTHYGLAANTVNRAMIALEQEGLIVRKSRSGVFVAPRQTSGRRGVVGCANFLDGRVSRYWELVFQGLRKAAAVANIDLLLLNRSSKISWEKVDGVIVHGAESHNMLNRLPPGMPAAGFMAYEATLPGVGIDEFRAQFEATQHLLSLGHKRIAMLSYTDATVYYRRVAGYRMALQEAGLETNERWVFPVHAPVGAASQHELGWKLMEEWKENGFLDFGCTAILAHNDGIGYGVVRWLQEQKLDVPGDVSVMGFDGVCDDSDITTPLLTTMEVPLQDIGGNVMTLLLRMIREESVEPVNATWPVSFRLGASTAPPRNPQAPGAAMYVSEDKQ